MKYCITLIAILSSLILSGQNLSFQPSEILFAYPDSQIRVKFDNPLIPIDYDGDSDVDFIGGYLNEQILIKNLGDNDFEKLTLIQGNQQSPFKAVDYDSDGDLDVFTERSILINEGDDLFSINLINEEWINYIVANADFNGDGLIDYIFQDSGSGDDILSIWYSNTDDQGFTQDTILSEYSDFGDLDFGDIDGDGDLDFAVNVYSNDVDDQLVIMYNDGGSFIPQIMPEIFNWGSKSMELTDLDNDNDLDFVLSDDNYLYFIENDGEPTEYLERVRVEDLFFFTPGDLDNDGDQDFVLVNKTDNWDVTVCILENLGNFNFSEPKILVEFEGGSSFNLQQNDNYNEQNANIYDYDGDGKNDIIYTDGFVAPSTMRVLINNTTIDNDNDGFEAAVDCDDMNAEVNPNQTEIAYNGLDDDCNIDTLDDDLDQDGYILADDCDDTNPNINPDAVEIVNNGIDEDCDGLDLTSSIHTLSGVNFNIYPNPTVDIIHLDLSASMRYKCTLHDLNGNIIIESENKPTIDLHNVPQGSYLLIIQDLHFKGKITEKIVKIN